MFNNVVNMWDSLKGRSNFLFCGCWFCIFVLFLFLFIFFPCEDLSRTLATFFTESVA